LVAANNQLQLTANDINNRSGSLSAATIIIAGNNTDNSGGVIEADKLSVSLTGDLINLNDINQGFITALDSEADSFELDINGLFNNGGIIQTNAETANINAASF